MSYGPSPDQASHPARGCFFYGCIISLVIVVAGVIAIGVGAYSAYRYTMKAALAFTAEAPAKLPEITMPEADRVALRGRFKAFREALEKGEPAESMTLSADDINALLEGEPKLKGKVHVGIDGDQVKAEISLPLGDLDLNVPQLQGRYLNGSATLRVSLRDGVLDVRVDQVEAKGEPLPESIMGQLRGKNLVERDQEFDPDEHDMMKSLERIEIKDSKIHLTPKKLKGAGAADPKATPDADPKANAKTEP